MHKTLTTIIYFLMLIAAYTTPSQGKETMPNTQTEKPCIAILQATFNKGGKDGSVAKFNQA